MISRQPTRLLLLVVCAWTLVQPAPAAAQTGATKRPITHNDYDGWKSIQGQRLSHDGRFLAYVLVPQEGDSETVVRNLTNGTEWRYGSRQPAAAADDDETGPGQGAGGAASVNPVFTSDGRFLLFQIRPTKAEADKARREKKRPEDSPKNALGIMNLATGAVTRVDRVRSFQVPEDSAGLVAYLLEPKAEDQKKGPETAAASSPSAGRTPRKKEYGTDLVVRSLVDSTERTFADVLEYSISRDAKALVFAVSSRNEAAEGVFVAVPGTASPPTALLTGKGRYTRLSWDEKQTVLAFVSDRDDAAAAQPKFALYSWDRRSQQAERIVSTATAGFRAGMVVSERAPLSFSLDGSRIFFGVAPPSEPEADVVADATDDKVVVDLWHWKDDFIQPMQKVRANQERNRSYRAVYHRASRRLVQLADPTLQTATPASDGRWALGTDDRSYRTLVGVDTTYADYFLVDTNDGSRKPIVSRQQGTLTWSPSGKYALFYRDKDWNVFSVADSRIINLTKTLGVPFWREDYDSPSAPPSYGAAGWTKDERYVLLNDRYDIWQVAADGSGGKNLTDGVGRKEQTVFRYLRLEEAEPGQERGIDPARPLLLAAVNEWTRDEGFYRDRIDGGLPERLLMTARSFGNVTKAKEADVVALTSSTFSVFPDLMVTKTDFKDLRKVTDANPQKATLLWGTSELIRFRNTDGVPLSGILMKPENFDPKKKYPMIVYIYEKLAQNVHRFVNPAPGHSINASYYVSNGYLVLEPDIVYTIGYPGQSALKCVLPAIQAVVDQGFVDENAIGIQGHSWGGYQIAYMVTQTNRFKAAAPGAVVANMTSAYSGVRWESGLPRQFQYEHTQSRIGGTLWEYPMRFLENSPLFRLDRVETPIMTIHNDNDGAVPWYQGIEFYLGLRRLEKEVYLFNYNGEPHGLRRRANQEDYARRLQQFFDHFLKGAAAPDWMQKGIPYLQRDKVNTPSERQPEVTGTGAASGRE
jgi:dipeptidyl aminopeptidase/acylaminoacyl peptidase